jgi:hypothetical protein
MRNGSMIVLNCGGTAGAYERIIEVHAARSPSGLGRFPFKEEVMGSNPIRATDFVRELARFHRVAAPSRILGSHLGSHFIAEWIIVRSTLRLERERPRRGVDARQDDGDDSERDEGAVASGARLMART